MIGSSSSQSTAFRGEPSKICFATSGPTASKSRFASSVIRSKRCCGNAPMCSIQIIANLHIEDEAQYRRRERIKLLKIGLPVQVEDGIDKDLGAVRAESDGLAIALIRAVLHRVHFVEGGPEPQPPRLIDASGDANEALPPSLNRRLRRCERKRHAT